MKYTNLGKVKLAGNFPDIVAVKNTNLGVKKPVRGHRLYSKFGFVHVT
ncbi:uncharacterized protein METZ01_LOCUS167073 [marine metagenome]|uniref:Uncharacterized protein n=1 Tax=marine metagenome TaxID=408172 RepID=A0A382BKT1_9ZZZZ